MSNAIALDNERTSTGLRMTVDEFMKLPGDGTGRLYRHLARIVYGVDYQGI